MTVRGEENDCNICGEMNAERTKDFGSFKNRGGSGSIGMDMCQSCWNAAKWHDQNQDGRCFNCGEPGGELYTLARPVQGADLLRVHLCRDCFPQTKGFMYMFQTEVGFRARANVVSDWDTQRRSALARDGYGCQDCGVRETRLHVHHIVPRGDGGTDHLDNLVSLCPDCHADRHGAHACELCGGISDEDTGGATWSDSGGGSFVCFCEECKKYIKKTGSGGSRCAICARFRDDTDKSIGISFFADYPEQGKPHTHQEPAPTYPACEKCRKVIIGRARKARESYLDEQLPDSHVNVRHWEGNDE